MWSVGCIFAEMLGKGKPLFPGSNALHQFALIVNVTGRPSPEVVASLNHPSAAEYINSRPVTPTTSLASLYPDASPDAVYLLERLLAFNPADRITAGEALALPYFSEFHSLGYGMTAEPLDEAEFQFERVRLSSDEMRVAFIEEIAAHHPEAREELLAGTRNATRYMSTSAAEQFRAAMDAPAGTTKSRTFSTDQFVAVNPLETPRAESVDYRSSTMGEAELSRYDLGPAGHNKPPIEDPEQEQQLRPMMSDF
jgi:serine/threonine protein kinase